MIAPTWLASAWAWARGAARWIVGAALALPVVLWLWAALKDQRRKTEQAKRLAVLRGAQILVEQTARRRMGAIVAERDAAMEEHRIKANELAENMARFRAEIESLGAADAWDRAFGNDEAPG